jgi:predicted RNase H-like HicB family nuclease
MTSSRPRKAIARAPMDEINSHPTTGKAEGMLEPPKVGRYPISICWSEEDEEYIVLVPDLPGCCASGLSLEFAIYQIQIAMEAWLECCDEVGRERPTPMPFERFDKCVKAMRIPDQYEASVKRDPV